MVNVELKTKVTTMEKWTEGCSDKNVEGIRGMHAEFRLTVKFASLSVQ